MCHVDFDTSDAQYDLPLPAEAPDAPWIEQNWRAGFENAGKSAEKPAKKPAVPPNFVENDEKWPFSEISRDMAEWFFNRCVIGGRKHICPHTGVIAIIFLADTGEQYVADDFDPFLHLVCDPRSLGYALYTLPDAVMTRLRHERLTAVLPKIRARICEKSKQESQK